MTVEFAVKAGEPRVESFYYYSVYFLVFSAVGWCIETALVSFQQKKFVNRGFLTGPFCPIYGVAMCFIILLVRPLEFSWTLMLVGSAFIACLVEYLTGWLLETLFHQRWWDYSDHRFNLNGRIAIPESLAWGPLTTLMLRYFVPLLDSVINRVPIEIGLWVTFSVIFICLADAVFIIYKMQGFARLSGEIDALRKKLLITAANGAEQFIENVGSLREKNRLKKLSRDERMRRRLEGAYPRLAQLWNRIETRTPARAEKSDKEKK